MDFLQKAAISTRDSIIKIGSPLLPILVMLIGFVVFSYATQNDACFTYDDWRRPFSLWSFSALYIGALLVVTYYAYMVKVWGQNEDEFKHDSGTDKTLRFFIGGIGIFFASALFLPTINLMSKNQISFNRVEIGSETKHPKQKSWTAFVAALLIYGTIIPLGKELGDFLSGNTILDQYQRA